MNVDFRQLEALLVEGNYTKEEIEDFFAVLFLSYPPTVRSEVANDTIKNIITNFALRVGIKVDAMPENINIAISTYLDKKPLSTKLISDLGHEIRNQLSDYDDFSKTLKPKEEHLKERELARQFMELVLVQESKASQDLMFVRDWEKKAETFIKNSKDSNDEDSFTSFMAILVNASKALLDGLSQKDQTSTVRNIAPDLFSFIKNAAIKYSENLREAVDEKKNQRIEKSQQGIANPKSGEASFSYIELLISRNIKQKNQ